MNPAPPWTAVLRALFAFTAVALMLPLSGCFTNPAGGPGQQPFDPYADDGCPADVRELLWWPTGLFNRIPNGTWKGEEVQSRPSPPALVRSPANWTDYHVISLAWAMPAPSGRIVYNEFRFEPGVLRAELDGNYDRLDIRDAFQGLVREMTGADFRRINDWFADFERSRAEIQQPFGDGGDASGSPWGRSAYRYHVDLGDFVAASPHAAALVAQVLPDQPGRAAFPLPQPSTFVQEDPWTIGLGIDLKDVKLGTPDGQTRQTLTVDALDQARIRSSVPVPWLEAVSVLDRIMVQAGLAPPDLAEVAFDRRSCDARVRAAGGGAGA